MYAKFDDTSLWETEKPATLQVLNREHLAKYTNGDEALEAELLDLFSVQIRQQIDSLNAADCEADWIMAAHTIKGGARGVGAEQIGEIAAQLENLGFSGEDSIRANLLTQLDAAHVALTARIAAIQR